MQVRRFLMGLSACATLLAPAWGAGAEPGNSGSSGSRALIELWAAGQPAFGQFVMPTAVPDTEEGSASGQGAAAFTVQTGLDLAANPLLDFAFLSLEKTYDAPAAIRVAKGIREGASSDTQVPLLVRIPPISVDGVDAARERVKELIEIGADGVVIPHVMSLDEARTAISFFEGADVWSPQNPDGDLVAMLIIEDPEVFSELEEIANLPGFSALVCGIGSLTSALGGDREAAERINQQVLLQSKRVKKPNLTTVDPGSVALRVEQGFLALLAYGPDAQEARRRGRVAAGRR